MSSFSRKTKTNSTSSGTATTTPTVPSFLQDPARDFYSNVSSLLSSGGPSAYGPTANQQSGFNLAGGLGVNSGMNEAMNGTRSALNYQPDQVTAQRLADTDLTSYMNPWDQSVVDAAGRDFQYANELGLNSLRAGTPTGAYGGSRGAISAGQLVGDNTRNFANTVAGLRQSGYQNAQNMALSDIANLLNTQTGNADRNLAGAGLRLGAANQLGAQSLAQDENTRSNVATQLGAGETERSIAQENDPASQRAAWLARIASLLGINPSDFIGQSMTSQGQQSGTTTQSGGFQLTWDRHNGFQLGYGG